MNVIVHKKVVFVLDVILRNLPKVEFKAGKKTAYRDC